MRLLVYLGYAGQTTKDGEQEVAVLSDTRAGR
jgi:hypothetical protein